MIYRLTNDKKRKLKNFNENFSLFKVRSGSECIFVQYESMNALKLYESKAEAEYSYKNQIAAYKDDIGPAAFGGVSKYHISKAFYKRYSKDDILYIPYPDKGIMYGFYTEVVNTACERDKYNDKYKDYFESKREYIDIIKELQKRFSKTKRKLYKLPAEYIKDYTYDLDLRNIGWRDDGTVVIIDFGSTSLEL